MDEGRGHEHRIRSRVISSVETRNATLLTRLRAERLVEGPADSIQRRSFTILSKLKVAPRSESAAMVATGAAFFMIVLDTSIVNLALPRIKDVFHADLTGLRWLVDGYALVFASLLLNAGALGDRYGAKRMFSAGLLIFCAASAACGLAPGMATLQCARAIQGIGAAILLPNSLAALNHTVQDPERRKIAVSAWSSAGALGIALGPLVGGVLVQYLDWRSIFLVNIPVGII